MMLPNAHSRSVLLFTLLVMTLNLAHPSSTHGQVTPPSYCWQSHACLTDMLMDGGASLAAWWQTRPDPQPEAVFVPPAGAGDVILPPGEDILPEVCSLTPSTGMMSGVNVRAAPSMDAPVIDTIPLGAYYEVTAVGSTWHETRAPSGRIGYVAARVAALVGPCGAPPRQD